MHKRPWRGPGHDPVGRRTQASRQGTQKHWPHSVPDQGLLLPAANWGGLFCPLVPKEDARAFGIVYRTQPCPNPDPPAPATRSLPAPPHGTLSCVPLPRRVSLTSSDPEPRTESASWGQHPSPPSASHIRPPPPRLLLTWDDPLLRQQPGAVTP